MRTVTETYYGLDTIGGEPDSRQRSALDRVLSWNPPQRNKGSHLHQGYKTLTRLVDGEVVSAEHLGMAVSYLIAVKEYYRQEVEKYEGADLPVSNIFTTGVTDHQRALEVLTS